MMNMKEDTALDYAEFRMTQSPARCDLFVSAGAVTERLSSIFLKQLLTHLRFGKEQIARGCGTIKLERLPSFTNAKDGTWFTKGTLERFVRFVTTPEVLERVQTIEDELTQLRQVREIQESSLKQNEDRPSDLDGASNPTNGKTMTAACQERSGPPSMSGRYPCNVSGNVAEASKIELLRAMDIRLITLQQDQDMAFDRAVAAGFDNDNIASLIAFAEQFGADRLSEACMQFIALSESRGNAKLETQGRLLPNGEASTSCSCTSLAICTGENMISIRDVPCKEQSNVVSWPSAKLGQLNSVQSDHLCTRVPPQPLMLKFETEKNTCFCCGIHLNDQQCANNLDGSISEKMPIPNSHSTEAGKMEAMMVRTQLVSTPNFSMGEKMRTELIDTVPSKGFSWRHASTDNPSESNVPSIRSPSDGFALVPDQDVQSKLDTEKNALGRSVLPRRRSTSPECRAQIGCSGVRQQGSTAVQSANYFPSQEHASRESNSCSSRELEISGSNGKDNYENGDQQSSATEPSRRLSVQDAINLFESKQRDSREAVVKRLGKQEGSGGSMEAKSSSVSGKSILRRQNGANDSYSESNHLSEVDVASKRHGAKLKSQSGASMHFHEDGVDSFVIENGFCLVDSTTDNQQCHQQDPEESSDNSLSHSFKGIWQQLQPSDIVGSLSTLEPSSDKNLQVKLLNLADDSSHGGPKKDLQKQFKIELERSLSREAMNNDSTSISIAARSKEDFLEANESAPNAVCTRPAEDQPNCPLICKHVSLEQREPSSHLDICSKHQLQSIQGNSGALVVQEYANSGWGTRSRSDSKSSNIDDKDNQRCNAVDFGNSLVKTKEAEDRESLGTSCNGPSEFNMQTMVNMVDNQQQDSKQEGSAEIQRGRLYEHYRKLRDAKLREEQASKRAEREAKLKAMEETLERRKAEMVARTERSLKTSSPLIEDHLLIKDLEAGLITNRQQDREKGEVSDKETSSVQTQSYAIPCNIPALVSSMPGALKDHALAPESIVSKKAATFQKLGTTPHSSNHVATSSPRPPSKNLVGMPGQRRSATSNQTYIADTSVAQSVPFFADLRKENTQPSSRYTSRSRVHPKNNGNSGCAVAITKTISLDVNGNDAVRSATGKRDKKRHSTTRKNCVNMKELKVLSAQVQGGVLVPIKPQREGMATPATYSKVRRSAVAPIQEVKPFLRKGHGIGPGSGPGIMKLKASTASDIIKNSDDEVTSTPLLNAEVNDLDGPHGQNLQTGGSTNTDVADDLKLEMVSENVPMDPAEVQVSQTQELPPECDKKFERSEVFTVDGHLEDVPENVKAMHSVAFPIDLQPQEFHTSLHANASQFSEPSCMQDAGESFTNVQLLDQGTDKCGQGDTSSAAVLSSFRTSSLACEHITKPFSHMAASSSCSSLLQSGIASGHFSPAASIVLDSSLESATAWGSSQIYYESEADVCSRKKWGRPQKQALVVAQQPLKEPAKGLKKFLKFGRKSRTHEIVTADWISAPATFEVQSLRSSITTPTGNFKVQESQLSRGTLLKAPRSFFSVFFPKQRR